MLAGMRVQQAGELSWNRCAAVLCCRSRGKGWRDCGSSRQQQQQDLMHSIECLTIQTCYHKTGAGFSSVACYLSLSLLVLFGLRAVALHRLNVQQPDGYPPAFGVTM